MARLGRFSVVAFVAALGALVICGLASPARAAVVDVTNTIEDENADINDQIDVAVGPGNSARLIGPWYQNWAPYTIISDVDLNGFTLTDHQGGNNHTWSGSLSGTGTFAFTGPRLTLRGAVANTFTGTYQITGTLDLRKDAGLDAIAGDLQIDKASPSTTVVRWRNSDQINNNSVVTLNPTDAAATITLRLYAQNDTIAGLVSTGTGISIVENNQDSGSVLSTLTVSPTSPASYTFSGTLRDGDGVGSDGPLAFLKTGTGTQVLAGASTHTGGTTVDGGILTLNGSLAKANVTVTSGTFGGSGIIKFQDGDLITVGSAGIFDASGGMKWDLAAVTAGSTFNLLDYTSGGTFTPPSTLNDLLDTASQASWSLTNIGSLVKAVPVITYAWDKDGNGDWTTPANWITGVPNSVGGVANFLDKITAPRTVNVDSPVTVGKIKFNNAFKYTVSSNTNAITLDTVSGNASIQLVAGDHEIAAAMVMNRTTDVTVAASDKTLTISKTISSGVSGTGINKLGAGTLLLSGTNSFDGPVAVNAGTLKLAGGSTLADTANVTVGGFSTLALNAATDDETIGTLVSNTASGALALNGGTLRLATNGANNTIAGLTGAGAVYKTGTGGTTTLTNNGSYTGTLNITGGTLIATTAGAFGDTVGKTTLDSVAIPWYLSPTATDGESFIITGGTTTASTANSTLTLNLEIQSGATWWTDTGGGNVPSFNGVISGEGTFWSYGGGGEFAPTYLGGAAANTLTGTTTVANCELVLNKPAGVDAIAGPLNIGTGATNTHVLLNASDQINDGVTVTIANKGDLRLNGWNETIGGLVSNPGEGTVGNYHASAPSILTVNTATADSTFGGTILDGGTGTLALTKTGDRILTLSGANTYTGLTTVKAGTLQLGTSAQSVVLTGTGSDIQGGKMVLEYSGTAPDVRPLLKASYEAVGGAWTGGQFMSTTADASHGLGWADNGVDQVKVAYTFYGDATLDGSVDATDLAKVLANYNQLAGMVWSQGDFDYNATVDASDLAKVLANYNQGPIVPGITAVGTTAGSTVVPEPSTFVLLAAGLLGLLCYAWRKRK